MPAMLMHHDIDPREQKLKDIGDTSSIEVFNNQVLVAVYMRPKMTKSGFILPDQHLEEDKFQSKVGLIIKKGPSAFADENNQWFVDVDLKEHDWVIFRPSDGWSITINGVLCRFVEDISIKGRIVDPDSVW